MHRALTTAEASALMETHRIRVTPVRVLVIKALSLFSSPASVQALVAALDTVDRSSIGRTLSLLTANNLVHAIDDGSGTVKYELCRCMDGAGHDSRHPHFHCLGCGVTLCLDSMSLPPPVLPPGYTELDRDYVIKGYCPDCSEGNH